MIDMQAGLGGGGAPISGVITINSPDIVHTANDNTKWLRSGYIETDPSQYPNAEALKGANLGNSNTVITNPQGGTWDGTFYWICTDDSDLITQYDSSWVPTGLTKNIGINPRGLAWDSVNSNFYAVSGLTDEYAKYDSSWVQIGGTVSVAAQDTLPRGIAVDGTHVFIVGSENDAVFRWTVAGAFVDEFFSVSGQNDVPSDIVISDGNFWVTSRFSGNTFEYGSSGVRTNREFETVSDTTGIIWNGITFWLTQFDGTVEEYSGDYVGIHREDSSPAGAKYMRVS